MVKMKGRAPSLLAVVSALVLVTCPSVARAQAEALKGGPPATKTSTGGANKEEAQKHNEQAKALYKEGKYLEALDAFRKAYDLAPSAATTYNIARCHERLSQYQEALAMYERYAKEESDPRDRAEALDKIETLKKKLGAEASTPDAKYQARIDAGRKAYSRGDYEGAIEEFKAAFDMKPNAGALYNIAKSYEKMARYDEAIEYFQQYLDLDPKATDRSDVEETIKRLKKTLKEKFQELSVSSDPPAADIYLDDRNTGLQGQTNYRFKVTPGPHTLYLDLNGYEPTKRDFIMPDDKPLALDFKMKKLENVGYVEIKVDQDGARIFVDGAIIGLSPYKLKKALQEGEHQIQVEQIGYQRYAEKVNVGRDQTTPVNVILEKYNAPIEDDTLSKWGRNLMLIGIIGGGLGIIGPFAYQKVILHRDPFTHLGPMEVTDMPGGTYRDPSASTREDSTHKTLKTIQLLSVIGGSVFTAGGLGFYIYKWVRTTPPKPVTADREDGSTSAGLVFTGFGIVPVENGAQAGLSGSF
jgi:tetratricopeptide (TPR) repeat protein